MRRSLYKDGKVISYKKMPFGHILSYLPHTYTYLRVIPMSHVSRSSVIAIEYEHFYLILILLYYFNLIDEEIALYPIKSIDYSMIIFKNCRLYVTRIKIWILNALKSCMLGSFSRVTFFVCKRKTFAFNQYVARYDICYKRHEQILDRFVISEKSIVSWQRHLLKFIW